MSDKQKLVKKLRNKEYREAWVEDSIKMLLPYQIQAMRNQRIWSQSKLGAKAGMKQHAVSRLESMDYGNLNLSTLLRLASAFDCALLVKFVPFSRLAREFEDTSPSALEVNSFDDDFEILADWENEEYGVLNEPLITTTSFYQKSAGDGMTVDYTPIKNNSN